MDNIASSPIQPKETPTESTAILQRVPTDVGKPTDEALSTFEITNQIPYSAKAFGMTKSQYFALKTADITDLTPKMEAIDGYVKNKIITDKYIDSVKTYDKMLLEIKTSLGIKDYESPSVQIEKIFAYINGGKSQVKQFHLKRTSKTDTLEHAKFKAMKELIKKYPNKTGRLSQLFNTFTR